jgi:hypothetical protein
MDSGSWSASYSMSMSLHRTFVTMVDRALYRTSADTLDCILARRGLTYSINFEFKIIYLIIVIYLV